jgi:hypothetical protein
LDLSVVTKSGLKEYYVGNEVNVKRGILCIKYPVERAVIDKWEEIEKVGCSPLLGILLGISSTLKYIHFKI